MHPRSPTVVEVRVIDEADLKAFAGGELDLLTKEAIEAYLLHHPHAANRVEAYRDAIEAQRKRRRLM